MLIFGLCFVLYFLKLSAGIGFFFVLMLVSWLNIMIIIITQLTNVYQNTSVIFIHDIRRIRRGQYIEVKSLIDGRTSRRVHIGKINEISLPPEINYDVTVYIL